VRFAATLGEYDIQHCEGSMKRVIVRAVTFVCIAVTGNAQSPSQQILRNPDFESGILDWTQRNCVLTSVSSPVQSGQKAVLVTNRTKSFGGPAQDITDSLRVNGYGSYLVSAHFRAQTGQDTAKIQIQLVVDGVKIYNAVDGFMTAGGWSHLIDTIHVNWKNATLSSANIYLQTKNDTAIGFFVDNVSLIPLAVTGGLRDSVKPKYPLDSPITPPVYAGMIKKGMDVGWVEFTSRNAAYSAALVRVMADAGIDHVRLRTGWAPDAVLFTSLDRQINDLLDNGMIPIIAYQGHEVEDNPDSIRQAEFVNWWRAVAQHYKGHTHKIAFNLLIEVTGVLSSQPATLNMLYERTVAAIRETNPTRIVIISPVGTSDPNNLSLLTIPSTANNYLMGEWHFYASGPSKSNAAKLWTTGTAAERLLLTDKIQAALAWEASTGIHTWVGAWMPGNYNKENEYSVPEQVVFASFMTRELDKAGIAWAVNADTHFLDFMEGSNTWTRAKLPVRDVMLDPWKVTLYSDEKYGGAATRLAAGSYNKQFLTQHNLLNNIKSFMIPLDFTIRLYDQGEFTGVERVYATTDSSLALRGDTLSVESIVIENANTATPVPLPDRPASFPFDFTLLQNYPNPFNPVTTIRYRVPGPGSCLVTLDLYDMLGREVAVLVNGKEEAGVHEVTLDASGLSSGMYVYRLRAGGVVQAKTLSLLR
jgi:hypothetical protein